MKTEYRTKIITHLTECMTSHTRSSEVFDDWVNIVIACLEALPRHLQNGFINGVPAEDTEEVKALWSRLNTKYTPDQMGSFSRAFAELLNSSEEWADTIGDVYQEFGHPMTHGGQYFTPWSVAKAMAEMTLMDIETTLKTKAEPVTICDPCCGSGVMLLAAASCCPSWAIQCGRVQFYGQDIDNNCVKMARINMMLYGLNGYGVRLADSIMANPPYSPGNESRSVSDHVE
jgi:type I restriction-modification system DNA methylase subunit